MAKPKIEVTKSQMIRDIYGKDPATSVKDVIATLGAKGVEVKEGLVYFVKGSMKAKQRKHDKQSAPVSDNGAVARSAASETKTQAVREFLIRHPRTPVPQLVTMLADNGISVTKSYVYVVKGKMQMKKHREAKARVASVVATSSTTVVDNADIVTTIKKIKHLANELGGLKKLKALIEALAE